MAKPTEDAELDAELDAAFGFPSEFPYEFDSFGAEPVDSNETENSDEEEDFFAGLTRRLSHETRKQQQLTVPMAESKDKTQQAMAGSPQSTLSGIGGWSGWSDGSPNGSTRVPSPTTTSLSENDAWDVLSAAAGQVARLKITGEASGLDFQNRGQLGSSGGGGGGSRSAFPPPIAVGNRHTPLNLSQIQYQQVEKTQPQCGSVWGRQAKSTTTWSTQQVQVQNRVRDLGYGYENAKCVRPLPRSSWHPLQVKLQNHQPPFGGSGSGSRPGSQGGSGVKRGCAGTGVFLPRQYGAPPPESCKKTNCAPVLVPAKVIHALNMNMNIDELNAARQPRLLNDLGVDYDALIARRNAILMQQRLILQRKEAASYEIRLPQEWTY
ncbi:uncharacterized protein LOC130733647 [Lotus japonicus]|uniref:uncharacterized protein LOC130733647 n=1 Tax=Lotus japonicus TaxID=34305 RepID=UPI00258EB586|nr:uncharacterized protein LOC130733647 [Lotus japonicus]